jgi:hypothetical protein
VDACYVAVVKALGLEHIKLLEFSVTSVTAGIDALGEVTVRLEVSHTIQSTHSNIQHTERAGEEESGWGVERTGHAAQPSKRVDVVCPHSLDFS